MRTMGQKEDFQVKNIGKIASRIAIIVIFVIVLNQAVRFLYEPPNRNGIYTVNEIKQTEGQVETLILGSSLAHWGVDGNMLGEKLNTLTLNLATSAQPLSGSYYFLKEQSKINPITRVFLGVHVTSMQRDNNKALDVRQWIYDRLVTLTGKLDYLVHTAEPSELEQYLLYATRIDNVLDFDKAEQNVTYKFSEEYENNIPPKSNGFTYYGMGNENTEEEYDGSYDNSKIGTAEYWNRDNILDTSAEYLNKIIKLCQERNIELNIFLTPLTYDYGSAIGDLEDLNLYFTDLCKNCGANFYDPAQDGNMYEIYPDEYFQDQKHLNRKGAEKFTTMLSDWYLNLESTEEI